MRPIFFLENSTFWAMSAVSGKTTYIIWKLISNSQVSHCSGLLNIKNQREKSDVHENFTIVLKRTSSKNILLGMKFRLFLKWTLFLKSKFSLFAALGTEIRRETFQEYFFQMKPKFPFNSEEKRFFARKADWLTKWFWWIAKWAVHVYGN